MEPTSAAVPTVLEFDVGQLSTGCDIKIAGLTVSGVTISAVETVIIVNADDLPIIVKDGTLFKLTGCEAYLLTREQQTAALLKELKPKARTDLILPRGVVGVLVRPRTLQMFLASVPPPPPPIPPPPTVGGLPPSPAPTPIAAAEHEKESCRLSDICFDPKAKKLCVQVSCEPYSVNLCTPADESQLKINVGPVEIAVRIPGNATGHGSEVAPNKP